jgi:alanine racemase
MSFRNHAEINLDNLAYNIHRIQERVAPARVIPVVKADAYGHGALPVVKRLLKEGLRMFAVAQFQEGMELRESGITHPILILGRLFPDDIPQAIRAGFRISIFGEEDVRWIEAARQKVPALVHVKLETGMGRTGILLEKAPALFNRLAQCQACIWEGLFSHFSTSDEKDKTYANQQLSRFQETLSQMRKMEKKPTMIHMASSGAILDMPETYFDAVRPGILMYGHYPSRETTHPIVPKQVMTLKSFVAHLREMPEGYPISYGRRWTTPTATTIAVLPIGYADGISRRLTNTGKVLIQGRPYPMVGRITMDSTMVDVGHDVIPIGSEAVIWGSSSQGVIEAAEVAETIGTIPYELTCGVTKRVQRIYVGAA